MKLRVANLGLLNQTRKFLNLGPVLLMLKFLGLSLVPTIVAVLHLILCVVVSALGMVSGKHKNTTQDPGVLICFLQAIPKILWLWLG